MYDFLTENNLFLYVFDSNVERKEAHIWGEAKDGYIYMGTLRIGFR